MRRPTTRPGPAELAARPPGAAAGAQRRPLDRRAAPAAWSPSHSCVFDEKVRPDAAETLAYFAEQGVTLKVISGDNPRTVAAVARRVGLADADGAIDAATCPTTSPRWPTCWRHTVFGRVTPQQKRAMVGACSRAATWSP